MANKNDRKVNKTKAVNMDKATMEFLTDFKKEIKEELCKLTEKFVDIDKNYAVHLEYCGTRCDTTDKRFIDVINKIDDINKKPSNIWTSVRNWGAFLVSIIAVIVVIIKK
jgi:hypothetical protein